MMSSFCLPSTANLENFSDQIQPIEFEINWSVYNHSGASIDGSSITTVPFNNMRTLRPWQTRTHCCGHIVADTLLPIQMFPRLPARATFVADTNFVSGTQKMFLILFRNSLCPQQMFPSLRSPRNIMGNNVSATMCPRLPGPQNSKLNQQMRFPLPSINRSAAPPSFRLLPSTVSMSKLC